MFIPSIKQMNQTFEISYWWKELNKSDYFLEQVDTTKIFISLDYFLSIYKGQFKIRVQEYEVCFDLRPDLSTIFEQIPLVLAELIEDTNSLVEFDFYEQGTDVGMLMERQGNLIKVRFETVPASGMRFKLLPNISIPVVANEFLQQWLQFVQAILGALVELRPELINDESYQEYISRLEFVRANL